MRTVDSGPEEGGRVEWLAWTVWALGLIAVFILWDVLFCGGKRCRELIDRF